MILSEQDARTVLRKVLSMTKARNAQATLGGSDSANIRFALNQVTTSGIQNNYTLSVSVAFGKRVGTASANQFDDASLQSVVRRAEEIARNSPENPEYMPPLDPTSIQEYEKTFGWDERTANLVPTFRAEAAEQSIDICERNTLIGAGFLEHAGSFSAFANTKGLFAYSKRTDIKYSLTARTPDGKGSGWAARDYHAAKYLNIEEVANQAAHRGKTSADAQPLEPGKYTAILDPACVSDLVSSLVFSLNARSADEGRSWVAEKGGGTKLGQQIFPESITIYSDPSHGEAPGRPWGEDGLPGKRVPIITNGILENLFYSRYWAAKQGKEPVPLPSNIIMEGGTATIDDMIASTERGILLSSLWYIRTVDPQTLLLTGLTRDGTYLIEKGKIVGPVKNFRWNESPVAVFKNVEMIGKSVRMPGRESSIAALVPPLKVKEFTFTSLSDAV
jgi:predicted Zn-dependent protease